MSTITSIDPTNRIWQVVDLLPTEQTAEILAVDWLNMPWRRGHMQEHWHRRWINEQHPTIQKLNLYVHNQIPSINQALGTNYTRCNGAWWLDDPGFIVSIHTDGEMLNSLQMAWIAPSDDYGTRFYFDKAGHHLMYQALGRTNTGYIMLNHQDENGAQPLHWHGMLTPVPSGTFRLSSYYQFLTD
jgi:hypothetical protein